MNKTILMGRLTKDPEVKYLQDENSTAMARYNKRSGKAGAPAGTGDSNVPLTAAAAALAAVGAGLVAYSARRTALEKDTANEDNSDRPR